MPILDAIVHIEFAIYAKVTQKMKLSEKIWIEKLAQASLTRPSQELKCSYNILQSMALFLEELCYLVVEYVSYFNEIVASDNLHGKETQAWSLFKLMQPRRGLIVTRGNDKLVISNEEKNVHIKMMQSHLESGQSERINKSLYFNPSMSDLGTVNWRCANDGQYVNPELVAKNYLSAFIAYGCKGVSQSYPRLVTAVGGHPVNK